MVDAKPCSFGVVFILSTFISTCCVHTASLRQYKLKENEPEYKFKNVYRLASPDMIKALEYIENLRQQTRNGDLIPDYDDLDQIRLSQSAPLYQKVEEKGGRSQLVDNPRDSLKEDESELVKIMVEALKQAEDAKMAPRGNRLITVGNRVDIPTFEVNNDDYEAYQLPEGRNRYLKKPRVPNDNENYRDSPYKRTNEIIEEQYTPQNIATLESVFKELGRLTEPNNLKKERLDEEQKLYKDDEEINKVNNIAFEDVVGEEEWNPMEEKIESQQTEEEEEIVDSKEELDKHDDIEDDVKRTVKQKFRDEEATEKGNRYPSSDDVSELISYLKKVMAKLENNRPRTGQNEDKKTIKPLGNEMDTQSIYQLIELSRDLQIPPEDLIDMLQGGDVKKQSKRPEAEDESTFPEDLDEISKPDFDLSKKTSRNDYTGNISENLPEELTADDILNVLGTDNSMRKKPVYRLTQIPQSNGGSPMLSAPNRRSRGQSLTKNAWIMDGLEKRQMGYHQTNDEDGELAEYLVNMLTKYPDILNKNQIKRVPTLPSKEDPQEDDRYDQALKEYLSQVESDNFDKATSMNKRVSTFREEGDAQNRHYVDEDMLRKMLDYLNKETEEHLDHHATGTMEDNM